MTDDTMQSDKSLEVQGDWVRWSDYDLVNGVIVPAEGAELEKYDPWRKFRDNSGVYRTVSQPYESLLKLHSELTKAERRGIRPSVTPFHPRVLPEPIRGPRTEADHLILEWCKTNGLLGLVPTLASSISTPIRVGAGRSEEVASVESRHHVRKGGSWTTHVSRNEVPVSSEDALANAAQRKGASRGLGVNWYSWTSDTYETRPLEDIELYFRPVWSVEPLDPPCPNSLAFWKSYGEPLRDFKHWCELFARSVDSLSQWKGGEASSDATFAVLQSHRILNGLAQSATPTIQFKPKRNHLEEVRVSASLLASYALMFLWDRADGRRAIQCAECGQFFVSDVEKAQYCRPTCRNTAQNRRHRHKKRVEQKKGAIDG